jgi:outer membrane protein TolC
MQKQNSFLVIFCLILLLPVFLQAEQYQQERNTKGIDLSLSLAVEQALANNLNLKLRREDVIIAEGAVQSVEGKFDTLLLAEIGTVNKELTPMHVGAAEEENTAYLSGELQKTFATGTEVNMGWSNNRFDSDMDNMLIDPAYSSILSLGVSQPLLKGWGTDIQTAEIQAAKKQLAASGFLVNSQAADLAALVKSAYWDLVFALQDIEVQQLSLTLAKTLLEEIKVKIEAGKLAQIELYQPQSEVARREETLIAAERAIGVAEDELKLLLNSENWFIPLHPTDTPQTTPVHLDLEGILTNALSNRPDIKAADLNIEAARIQTAVATDNTRPSLAMAGSVGYGGTDGAYGDAVDIAFDKPDTRWQVGLNFSVPLQNSHAKGVLVQAMAIHRKAKTDAKLLRLQVKKSIRTTVRDVNLAIKAMEATRKTSIATLKRLEAEQVKFDAGSATTLDVLIAQDAYSQALSQENRIDIIYVKSLAEIDRIQGIVSIQNGNLE